MSDVRLLSQEVINQIAAGEVVERPASVVKELIENAIDADASTIIIEIRDGGTSKIQITDDGKGMSKEDLEMAIKKHATSKISGFEDLYSVQTMGFRGEALAAISSVSKCTIVSKQEGEIEGSKVYIKNNQPSFGSASAEKGTRVVIDELFYNVPARKKFLKTASTEYGHIQQLFVQYAMLYTNIHWKLIHNDALVYNTPKVHHLLDRIKQLLGSTVGEQMMELSVKGDMQLRGFFGKPSTYKKNKKSQFLFVNRRPIQDAMISRAVKDAYSSLLEGDQYPTFVLHIEIHPSLVDVNVHPRKTEIKFQKPQDVYRLVHSSVKNLLVQNNIITTADLVRSFAQPASGAYTPADDSGFVFKPKSISGATGAQPRHGFRQARQVLTFAESIGAAARSIDETPQDDWKLIGQAHNAFLIVEVPEGIAVIDQHAAAERIRYERLLKEAAQTEVRSQKLLTPITIELSLSEQKVLEENQELLTDLGFDVEFFGQQSFVVQGVPHDLGRADIQETFIGLLGDLDSEEFSHLHDLEDKKRVAIKYAACRGAIMFNDMLSREEQLALLRDIKKLDPSEYTCCHGRPFMKVFERKDLEKLFHRH